MSNDKLMPELRFPEFEEQAMWEEKTLESIAEVNPKSSELPDEFVYVDLESVENGTLQKMRTIQKKIAPSRAQRLLKDKDVIFQMVRPYQKNNFYFKKNDDIDYVASTGYAQLRAIESSLYLYHFLHTDNFISKVLEKCTGSNYPAINSSHLSSILVQIPKPQEQQKIASCLSTLDEAITAHSQKLDLLKEHKKGLMQNLFPQEGERVPKFRFKEFEKDGEWVEKILSEVADYENGKAHEQDIKENGNFVVVNSKFISTDGQVAKNSNKAYCLSAKGDILMVLSDIPNGRAIAKCFYVKEDNRFTVNQRICKITANKCDSLFLYYVMNRNPYFLSFDDGVKQTNLRNDDVQSFRFLVSIDLKEQQKIASCLSSLDALIAAQAEKIEQLKLHKKGLMQGLFPKIVG